ncbi:ATP-binding protein [Mycobacterium sp. CVI_P3]|uniref:ATP-binding protein n=1 Tax=Mycobacterium pinniadriaticum TaxID=2994102 RepID=A0ABT3SP82_9MYCO|nr:ATP-binding protein [Mycobacterium pinniadriaticum]MCX2934706.1 ATP-binding protein [Mycobacterium pinniadriaticum]MCX2941142.1 ATP-binding protein [Mycobacterium pinniadriaticum]
MRLRKVKIRNFRCYIDEVAVELDSLTSIIGRNDAGKSTVLEALAIFFDQQKPDSDDAAKDGQKSDMSITCEFDELPEQLIVDSTSATTLTEEYLLNEDGHLEIRRTFNGELKTPTSKVFIRANHPSADNVGDLLALKNADLKKRAVDLGVDLTSVNQRINAELRAAIRDHVGELDLQITEIEVDIAPGAKELYARLKESLPAYFLFRSDRPSTDQDSEAQDPMKVAVRVAIEEQRAALDEIALSVRQQVRELIDQTLLKIKALSPEIASELNPEISDPKWDSIFKISLTGESAIPLNKRGSGVRRLVLLGFLQAQAESRRAVSPDTGIIYAIEEPETSQHPDTQRVLLQAIEEIAQQDGYQVLMTTHTPMLGRLLPTRTLRYVAVGHGGAREIHYGDDNTIREVAKALGVLPDHDVRVFVGVEGKHDESFLKHASRILSQGDPQIDSLADLESQGKLIFIPVGGSNVGLWVSRLHHLDRPEYHIFDRDHQPPALPHYESQAAAINARQGCTAVHTTKREIENYLDRAAIVAARPEVAIPTINDFDDVPEVAAQKIHAAAPDAPAWATLSAESKRKKQARAKGWLNDQAAALMTQEMFTQSDPNGEISGWLRDITALARSE